MTASFGITALNELQELYNGKSLVEDGQFALDTLKYINDKVAEFKKEDGILYAIYGTPAESLCGLQIEQFRKQYGIVRNVSDRPYVSNSFHCHVTEDITPIQKQDLEGRFWELCNGGKIQYVRYPVGYNKGAIKTLIERAMELGYYEGVNLSLAYCDDCGHQELDMDVCPVCGSKNLTKIDRMNGYLSYSRVHGDTRLNEAKMAEIAMDMINRSVESYVQKDLEMAREVIDRDDVLDELFINVRKEISRCSAEKIYTNDQTLDLLMIAKYYERLGDHATNVAEWVEFSLTGKHRSGKEVNDVFAVLQ